MRPPRRHAVRLLLLAAAALGYLGTYGLRADPGGRDQVLVDRPLIRAADAALPHAPAVVSLPYPALDASSILDLVDQPWREATTGWQVLADFDTPIRDSSFTFDPMLVAGEQFTRGISTYPFSEILYDLDARVLRFDARVGVTDDSREAARAWPGAAELDDTSPVPGAGSVRFFVYGDDLLLYDSGIVNVGERARVIDVGIAGFHQLRLIVDDAGDGSLGDYALWAEPRISVGPEPPTAKQLASIAEARDEITAAAVSLRVIERATLGAYAAEDGAAAARHLRSEATAQGAFDPATSTLVLGNDRLVATLGYGGPRNGRLSMLRLGATRPTLADVTPTLLTESGRWLRLAALQSEHPDTVELRRVEDPFQGRGMQVVARFRAPEERGAVVVTLRVFDGDAALELQVRTEGIPVRTVRYLDPDEGALVLEGDIRYLTDRSHLYQGEVRPDGHLRRAPFEATKPALLWSKSAGEGVLFSIFDYVPSPAWVSLRHHPGREVIALGVELDALLGDFGPAAAATPALSIELVAGPVGPSVFQRFQRIVQTRYPGPDWPASARYQWGHWYVYGPGVNAEGLRRQIGALADRFVDLGAWQFAIDAGWYAQYVREDAEIATVDFDRFPQGMRGVTDAAHARGIEVILYLGAGFVHDSPANGGEWMALRGLIARHPEWLIPFQCAPPHPSLLPPGGRAEARASASRPPPAVASCLSPSGVRRYLLDYTNPEVVAYFTSIVRDFFAIHGADGIIMDGVVDAEGQLIPRVERDRPSGPPHPLLPTLDIYRLIHEVAEQHRPGAFIESGWLHPIAARPFIDAFWYADDLADIDGWYPFAGFFQRLDYALFSRAILGQRSYLGTASGDPGSPGSRWRLHAAAALAMQTTLSLDLDNLNPSSTAILRADLAAIEPFAGTTRYGPGLFPEFFATTRNGVTYLGVVNREHRARAIQVQLEPLGLEAGVPYTVLEAETGRNSRIEGDFAVELPARSFRLLVLRGDPGVLWTSSVVEVTGAGGASGDQASLIIIARGPVQVPGFAHLATPPPTAVSIDGVPLRRAGLAANDTYAYDDSSGLLSLIYTHSGARQVEVRW